MEVERVVRALASTAEGRVLPIVALGLAFVLVGLWAERHISIETDPERFVPSDSKVIKDLWQIRDVAGSSNQLDVMVEADDVTRPEVLDWIGEYTQRQIDEHPGEIVRAESMVSIVSRVIGGPPTTEDVEAIAGVAPAAITDTFISADRTRAHIIFAIGPISLRAQDRLLDEMKADLNAPPGVTAAAAGLAVIGIEAVHALADNRLLLIYAALAVKLMWFLIIYRSLMKTALALLPIVIAVGSASAAIYLLGIELNPLTTLSTPLVIAVSVEFSVLIMARYYEERGRGLSPREAVDTASTRIGRAITASGLTTIGGFGVLAFSGFPLLSSFGIVTSLNVAIALLATLVILPELLVWADEETGLVPVREDLRPAE
jgi:predicted RND superfamily exporter protein